MAVADNQRHYRAVRNPERTPLLTLMGDPDTTHQQLRHPVSPPR